MKINKIKNLVAVSLAAVSMFLAATSSSMCIAYGFEDIKMPKSLYKVD